MSALNNIAAFAQGATQGVGQGMDYYAKYKQLQDEGEARNKRQAIDQEVQQLSQAGVFEKDPIDGMHKVADIYLKHGLPDDWAKYNQAAVGLKKAKTDQIGMQVFQAAGVDPVSAVPLMNKFAEATGSGDKFELTPNPGGGFTMNSTVGGKTTPVNYNDPQALEHAINQYIAPYLMGDIGKFQTNQAEIAKDAAAAGRDTQATASDAALLGPRVAAEKAQAASGYASADASRARAASEVALRPLQIDQAMAATEASRANTAQSKAQMDEAQQLLPGKVRAQDATADYTTKLGEQVGKPQAQSSAQVASELVPAPVPDLDGNMPQDPAVYKQNIATLADMINQGQGGGMDGTQSVAAATVLAHKLSMYSIDDIKVDRATGVIHFPDGTTSKVDPSTVTELPQYAKKPAKGP